MAGNNSEPAAFQGSNLHRKNYEMDVDEDDSGEQQPLHLEKGLSDDDGLIDLFDDTRSHKSARKKKVPRRFSNDARDVGNAEPSPTKKQRTLPQPLFGGGNMDFSEANERTPPQTPGTGLGIRLSSLYLDQQQSGDGDEDRPNLNPSATVGLPGDELYPQTLMSSPRSSTESGHDHDDFQMATEDPVKQHGLRQNINRQGVASTHIDIDQSGNYDPVEEMRQRAAKQKARQKTRKGKQKAPHIRTGKGKEKKRPKKLIIGFKIDAIGTVLNIWDGEEHKWPEGHSEIDTDDEAEAESLQDNDDSREFQSLFRSQTPNAKPQIPIPDPADEEVDLTGHPVARGCKQCRKQKQDCSMVKDGQYPCTECSHDLLDCYPIIELGSTRRCKRCEEQGRICSFESANGDWQSSMCQECLEDDDPDCEMRPPEKRKSSRVDLDQIMYGETRKWVSCTHCREGKHRCSVKKRSDKPPCKRCKRLQLGCHFYDAAPREDAECRSKKKNGNKEQGDGEGATKSTRTKPEEIISDFATAGSTMFTPEDLAYINGATSAEEAEDARKEEEEVEVLEVMEDMEGHRGFMTKIRTSFAHPMIFCVAPPGHPNSVRDCNFCEIPIFGMVGHFEREVHVIEWSNGLGYTEFGNGHREDGYGPTTMCQQCTFSRLQIMVCPAHIMQPLENTDGQDYKDAAEDLMSVQGGTPEMQRQLQRWCSMCFSLATHRCFHPQPYVGANEDDMEEIVLDGCGLGLCDRCVKEFDQVYQNNLLNMATSFEKEHKPREGDDEANEHGMVRADVGLLKIDGLLMKNIEGDASEDLE